MSIGVATPPVTVLTTGIKAEAFKRLAVAAAVLSAIVSGLALVSPVHTVNPAGRAAIETTIALSAIITACLFSADFQQRRRLTDLLLLCAFVAVSLADVSYRAVPALAGTRGPEPGGAVQLCCDVLISCVFAAVAFAPGKSIPGRGVAPIWSAVAAGAALVALPGLLDGLTGWDVPARSLDVGAVGGAIHPVTLAAYVASAGVLVICGFAFLRRVGRGDDRAGFLAPAAFLLAGARLQYLAAPVVGVDWVTPREGLRVAAYAFLLAGAYWQSAKRRNARTTEAVSSERERIARDLHDGLAQDLACIAAQGQRLDLRLEPGHPLMVAARNALATSRGVITDLSASKARNTRAALGLVADELGHRFDLNVEVLIEPANALSGIHDLEPGQREHLVRIVREAIVNAALHGAADQVDVLVQREGRQLLMRVSDDGCGIADAPRSGLGTRSMRARAGELGGRLRIERRVRGGTVLELLVHDLHQRRASLAPGGPRLRTADRLPGRG